MLIKPEMQYEGRLVTVLCVEPNGTWAMVRVKGYGATMPFVVRVKELSEASISQYGETKNETPLCRWCNKPEADHTPRMRHKFLAKE